MKPGERAVARQLDQPLEPDARLDLGALGAGPPVVPEDRGPKHAVAVAEHDEPVHLPREPDRARRREPRERGLGRAPPVLGVLLGPPRAAASRAGSAPRRPASTSPSGEIATPLTPLVPTSRPTRASVIRRTSSIRLPNGSRHVNRGRPTSSVRRRVSTRRRLEPRPQPVESSTTRQKCGSSGGGPRGELAGAARCRRLPRTR